MTDESQAEKLTARMERMRPPEPPKRRRGINPYALSAVTAVAGVGVGAWLVLAAPEAPASAPAIETASVSDFQGDGTDTDGFNITKAKPQIAPAAPDRSEEDRLQAEVDTLNAQIADLKANPVTVADEAALLALKAQVDALGTEAKDREAARAELERENIRLQTELDTKALIAGDGEAEAARAREEELARRRQEAEALKNSQIHSDMVALRSSGDMGSEIGAAVPSAPPTHAGTGDDAFRRAGAKAAEVRQAEVIADPANTVMQGTLIEAALETALSTDLAGNVAAIVSHDVWSFDMSRVVIPRGSRLFGRYDSDVSAGQRRVLIAWDRVVTTDGQSVSLAAYGTDRIGRSGLPGKVRNHFLKRFGTATLISVIGAVPAIAAAKYQDNQVASDTAESVGTDLGEAVNTVMADYLSIPPTISVNQGAVVMIRVDADIAFY
ncbi:type IV secretion system protein VirB10 [Gemmobacter aquatilis]|uniref:Type IV secretion system protein VirB10 n=1 Tax=Gemmobacter aquatilis TaxID=933059 RepID=A0A1H8MQ61_9RHOB|nr:TrbI/VirB10 family protein [Gemmobacter aquatilis]SEO19477.1 type IV secretion system protein VirB10 [Gemmobacter aquatilis]